MLNQISCVDLETLFPSQFDLNKELYVRMRIKIHGVYNALIDNCLQTKRQLKMSLYFREICFDPSSSGR